MSFEIIESALGYYLTGPFHSISAIPIDCATLASINRFVLRLPYLPVFPAFFSLHFLYIYQRQTGGF